VILACAEGGTIGGVAAELGVSRDMVSKWRAEFLTHQSLGQARTRRNGPISRDIGSRHALEEYPTDAP
jgi:transposase-like protein